MGKKNGSNTWCRNSLKCNSICEGISSANNIQKYYNVYNPSELYFCCIINWLIAGAIFLKIARSRLKRQEQLDPE
jgi:hypothetical protein